MNLKLKSAICGVLFGLSVLLSGCGVVDCYNKTGMGSTCVYEAVRK